MEGQITLNEWLEWKEDIRRKLAETAENFVYIGYRLRQIRDSGMLDGCSDIFEFAQKEYGLGKSTVSRFIAINEKFSEGGNSLELRREFRAIGSSKLAEMLTLTDAECQLITERTTVKEIRELKNLDKQEEVAAEVVEQTYTPLQKCIIDYFSDEKRKDALDKVMSILAEDASEESQKAAMELINPGEYATHKKGIVFLFMYDFNTGVKYKQMGMSEPTSLTWTEFLAEIIIIYKDFVSDNGVWSTFYKVAETTEEKAAPPEYNQGFSASVATSQQTENSIENEGENIPEEEVQEDEESEKETLDETTDEGTEEQEDNRLQESEGSINSGGDSAVGESASGRDGDHEAESEPRSDGDVEVITPPLELLRAQGDKAAGEIADYFWDNGVEELQLDKLRELKVKAEEVVAILEQMIELKEAEE